MTWSRVTICLINGLHSPADKQNQKNYAPCSHQSLGYCSENIKESDWSLLNVVKACWIYRSFPHQVQLLQILRQVPPTTEHLLKLLSGIVGPAN
ncbi:MAG TPA: hypothetical protein VFC84_17905 [Desulfosporosinus sp.]|nr:hypothetical protein [Desulfosporosinus sp.]